MMQRAAVSLCLALAAGQSVASLDDMRAARIHSPITKEDTSGVYVDNIPVPMPGEGEASQGARRTARTRRTPPLASQVLSWPHDITRHLPHTTPGPDRSPHLERQPG